jgi:hypothetical protein
VGQTDRRSKHPSKNTNQISTKIVKKSLYAKQLLQRQRTLHPIEKSITILHHQKESKKLDTIEQYHIYRATKTGKQLN